MTKPAEYIVFPWIVGGLHHYAQIESETPMMFKLKGVNRPKTLRKDVVLHRCFNEDDARNLRDRLNDATKRRNQLVQQVEEQYKTKEQQILSEFKKRLSAQPPKKEINENHPLQ